MRKEERDKIVLYKDYPEGSYQKHLYDENFLPLKDYIYKYYKDKSMDRWMMWINKFVYPLFNESERENYYQFLYKAKPSFYPEFTKLKEIWPKISLDNRFDNELKHFFAFLYTCGFFNTVNFEDWLNSNNWLHPWYNEPYENNESILEILKYNYGIKYIKLLLIDMPWLNT